MPKQHFALFVDMLGVQRKLLEATDGLQVLREDMKAFHEDLARSVEAYGAGLAFVAEFSDAAYIVGTSFTPVAKAGIALMRSGIAHCYPLRGGFGLGSFHHEVSGARAIVGGQVWGSSVFLGSAIVRAYQGERKRTGLRIFVHEAVMRRNQEGVSAYTQKLAATEETDGYTHELRIWQSDEVDEAVCRLIRFRDAQELSPRARAHYDASCEAWNRQKQTRRALHGVGLPASKLFATELAARRLRMHEGQRYRFRPRR